jgi:hypothetical protein
MAGKVPSEDARFDIGRTAGTEIDHDVQSLALIEGSLLCCKSGNLQNGKN